MSRVRITAVIDGTFYYTRSYEDNESLKASVDSIANSEVKTQLLRSDAKELSYEKFLNDYKDGKNIVYFWMDGKWIKDTTKNIIKNIARKKIGKYADLL